MIEKSKVVWSLFTRLLHWLLAFVVFLNLFILESGEDIHQWIGYLGVAIVIARLISGFFLQRVSLVLQFPIRWKDFFYFIKHKLSDPEGRYEWHNPLASLVYLLIWVVILALGISGFAMDLDAFWGEVWLQDLHKYLSWSLQGLLLSHFAGIVSDSLRHKRKTWMRMISGRK